MTSEYGLVVKRREVPIRPEKGFVVENYFDVQSLCWRREVVTGVRETATSVVVTFKSEHFYKAGQDSHDFWTARNTATDDKNRKCAFCGAPYSYGKAFSDKCPKPHTRTHMSSRTMAKFLVVGGKLRGQRLTQDEAGDNYAVYNRSTRWGKTDKIPKAVLIPKDVLL